MWTFIVDFSTSKYFEDFFPQNNDFFLVILLLFITVQGVQVSGMFSQRTTEVCCCYRVRLNIPQWCWWHHQTGAWECWWRPTPTAAGWEDLWTTEREEEEVRTSVNWVSAYKMHHDCQRPVFWQLCVCLFLYWDWFKIYTYTLYWPGHWAHSGIFATCNCIFCTSEATVLCV